MNHQIDKMNWDDPYIWIHDRAKVIECSACGCTTGRDELRGWGSIGKGVPPHLLADGETNPPFSAWLCSYCNQGFEEQTGVKIGTRGWLNKHAQWLEKQNLAAESEADPTTEIPARLMLRSHHYKRG